MSDVKLVITSVERSLVLYRRCRMQPKGVPTAVCSKREFQKY